MNLSVEGAIEAQRKLAHLQEGGVEHIVPATPTDDQEQRLSSLSYALRLPNLPCPTSPAAPSEAHGFRTFLLAIFGYVRRKLYF